MTTKEIMEQIREGLTGEYNVDIVYLEAEADKYHKQKNGREIESAIVDLAYEILPQDRRELLNKMMYIDGVRLDNYYTRAVKLSKEGKTEESFTMSEALYTKIRINYRETEEEAYYSFRNSLEHQLYMIFYQPSKKIVRPPFDLSQMILLHGYNLIDLKRYEEAERVIGDAIRFNPMNTDAYFELAECYKAMKQPESLLSVTKETLDIAVSPVQIARCYCNLGFYAVEIKDYESAICFYYESLIYSHNQAVEAELFYIHKQTNKKISPPSREKVNAAFEKYNMVTGPNKDVVDVISRLAADALQKNDLQQARFYVHLQYDLTHDPQIKEMVDRYDAIAKENAEKAKKAVSVPVNESGKDTLTPDETGKAVSADLSEDTTDEQA